MIQKLGGTSTLPPAPMLKQDLQKMTCGSNYEISGQEAYRSAKAQKNIGSSFPDPDPSDVWNRTERKGFTTIPRNMPLIGKCMDHLAGNGTPIYETHLTMWFRVHDFSIIKIIDHMILAEESGFRGSKAVSTWRKRIKILEELGFIKSA